MGHQIRIMRVLGGGRLSVWSLVLVSSVLWSCGAAFAQDRSREIKERPETAMQMEMRGIEAMSAGDWETAQGVFEAIIERKPESYVGYYNLAGALSRQGHTDEAIEALSRALVIGFSDKWQLFRDPDLAGIRKTAFFDELMKSWGEIVDSRHASDLERMDKLVRSRKMEHRTLDDLRLEIVSAHDPVSTDQAVEELKMITDWATTEMFIGLKRSLGPGGGDGAAWVMVGLPEKTGFLRWAIETFGPGVRNGISSVGGAYEHQQRRLVAQDLGATLRHEFIHVLHWRDMSRLGQNHAAWVQEGLASVVEDYDVVSGRLVPVASWRTNMVKRLVKIRKQPSIGELAAMDLATFTNRRPLARYAQARTVMMWLLDRGELGAFYNRYLETYKQDQTGLTALIETVGMEVEEIDTVYEEWVRGLPEVAETGDDLDATLGISIENGSGDGVVVKGLSVEARRRTGLRLGMVITGIDRRPTRDMHELIRVLGDYRAGQSVQVRWRRGTIHGENDVVLLGK